MLPIRSLLCSTSLLIAFSSFAIAGQASVTSDEAGTRKVMDGLFVLIAEKEKQIRSDPIGTGSSILKKVFGSIGK